MAIDSNTDYVRECLDMLIELRDEWPDEIPSKIVHFGPYKARVAWFQSVYNVFKAIKHHGVVSSTQIKEYEKFYHKYRKDHLKKNHLITEEEIRYTNSLLSEVIDSLEKRL